MFTSTEVVLLKSREICMTTKQRRLSTKARLRTALRDGICKKYRGMRIENAAIDRGSGDAMIKGARKFTKGQKGDS